MNIEWKPVALAASQAVVALALVACGGGSEEGERAAADDAPERARAAAVAAATWVQVAVERQTFTVTGTKTVRYGAGTRWVQRSVTGTATCSNGYFGSDPAYGVVKSCQVDTSTPVPTGWTTVASERDAFSVSGTRIVRYGADVRWVQKSVTTSGLCTNGFFGSDPAYGVLKSCEVQDVAPAPTGTACDSAPGRVLLVGPGKTYAQPSAAAAAAVNGDVIKISAGDYRGDVTTWYANNLTICGVGGRARLFADGRNAQGKGIWVIQGSNAVVDSIEFHNATVPDENGAGIRAEGLNLTIKNSGFYDNENGILGGDAGTINIERSEFARNGFGDGYTHNIYIGPIDRLNVTASYFHEAKIGHNLKSRAKQTYIENSYFMDGPTGTSSYLVDFPNGGVVYLRGNLFQKGPNADNSIAIAYGQEGLNKPVNTLEMVHNTVVMTRSGGTYITAPGGTQSVTVKANLFAGTGSPGFFGGGFATGNIVQQGNVFSSASNIPGADNVAAPRFWPNATLQALIALGTVPDSGYTKDVPVPYRLRAITSSARLAGALQSAP
jgi:hypothetical protein